jgi:glutathione synthase/RimK-type ligase-like ATP-grasp enzyme
MRHGGGFQSSIRAMRIALASCKRLPEPDPDEALLVDALRRAGAEARVLAWDDEEAPFADHDVVVVRSTWNYYERVDDFVAWAERTARRTRLFNPPSIVAANAEKTYLRDLAARGVEVVPTEYVHRGEKRPILEILEAHGWDGFVVKPVVSAGSYRTERFDRAGARAAQSFLDDLVRDRDAMVQPWMPSVETYGERSVVWIDGEVTHAIRKSPRLSGGAEQVSGEVPVAPEELDLAARAVEPYAGELLYARVDMVRDDRSETLGTVRMLRIMELELIEPSLFFRECPRALERFVRAVTARAK